MLSAKQRRILDFISDFYRRGGYPPTLRDIARSCHISSTSVISYNLNILEREGYIHRLHHLSRGIELAIKPPQTVRVPFLGQIAAGEPISPPPADTWDNPATEVLDLTEELIRGKEGVFALRVKGKSMVDAFIDDGDIVLMQHTAAAEDGEMVAIWLKKEKEVTLKKLYREGERIRLQPANEFMQPLFTTPDNVEIQGRVIGVLRQLG